MKLRTIELDQFRKFDRPVRLHGLGDGINVLCGPNEHGKSTVLAALRAVLFDRHSSRGESIRGYQHHRGSTAPSVALEFEHEGASHRIEKRFLSRATARLVSAGTAYDGDAAEEQLARLLGVSVAGRATKDAAQAASIWGALLVAQGDSFAQARLGESARTTLSECLEAELGSVSGGAAIGRLLKQVQAQLAQLLDGHGRPRDRYKAAIAEQDEAAARIATLEQRRRSLQGDLDAVAEAGRTLVHAEDPDRAARTASDLDAARRHREATLGYRHQLAQAESLTRLALAAHEEAEAERDRRAARSGSLAAVEHALSGLVAAEAEARARADQARSAVEARRAAFETEARAQDQAERALQLAALALDAAELAEELAGSGARLAQAEDAAARIDAMAASIARLRPDEAGLHALQALELEDRRHQAALQAQATRLELSLEIGATLLVADAAPRTLPPGPVELSLTRPAELLIEGVGRLRITPAARDREALHAQAAETAGALRRALDAAGCSDLAEAGRRVAERRRLATEREQAQRALDRALTGAAPGMPGLDTLRRHVVALQGALAERLVTLALERPPEPAPARAARDEAARQAGVARDAAAVARTALLAPDAEITVAEARLRQAEFDRRDRGGERDRLAAEQALALDGEPDEALAERMRVAQQALSARRLAQDALTASAPDGTPEMADATIRRLEEIQSNRRHQVGQLREEIARLGSRIASEEGIGLDEQIEEATRAREAATRATLHHRREADILGLLRDTLAQADREARERYLAPLMTRMSPYLQALFPRAELSLREDFLITGLSRLDATLGHAATDGGDETFDSLSHGTREQIAILSRLAFADMLLASGKPAFLVLDDALAFADPVRMERMFDILSDAGRRMQILVLTCREDLAAGLGGTRVKLMAA